MDLQTLEYPRHLHKPVSRREWDRGVRVFQVVNDARECEQAIADGWQLQPSILEPAGSDPIAEPVPEPKRRGRKGKA